jgi:hypothetical protein
MLLEQVIHDLEASGIRQQAMILMTNRLVVELEQKQISSIVQTNQLVFQIHFISPVLR